ncbi:MAG: ABC-F family ATP-binding cassette domain-containing protein [Sphingobium sp.]
MPASPSVTLAHLGWSTPDGRIVLSGIDASFTAERTGLVGRNGTGKSTLLALIAGTLRPQTGAVIVNGTIGLLRQIVEPGPDQTIATLFDVTDGLALLARAEAGAATDTEFAEADWTLEARLADSLSKAGLDVPPDTPLHELSGGQRTRAALAALLFAQPDFLLLDEPTNNLDREGRAAVLGLLRGWRGGMIVASHDRELLEAMDAIAELTTLGLTRYGGNWSQYRALKNAALDTARHDLADAQKQADSVARAVRTASERKARKDKIGRRDAAKGGTPRILLGAMKNRAEESSGADARLAERQHAEAAATLSAARAKMEVLDPFTVALAPTGLSTGKTVLSLDDVTAGYEPSRPLIERLSFTIAGPERIAITGPNGSGKSSLLALTRGTLKPWSGTARIHTPFAMLDQQVSLLDAALSIRDNFHALNPGTDENSCRAALARFMFRADAALQPVGTLSGGQRLRAGLACILGGSAPPPLLLLDEPTNHLDLESIESIERGLATYDGALLVVSHDEAFLDAIGITRRLVSDDWHRP